MADSTARPAPTALGRLYAARKGHVDVVDWRLPDGQRYTLQITVQRGSSFGAPLVSGRLMRGDELELVARFRGRLDTVNHWLSNWSLRL